MSPPQTLSTIFSQARLQHGPIGLLGRTILLAENLVRGHGVSLRFVSAKEFRVMNAANTATWHNLFPLFDCEFCNLTDANSFFIIGRNGAGDDVACQAARFYNFEGTDFASELKSMRALYDDPQLMQIDGEEVRIDMRAASGTTGRVAFSGAAWYRPDYRGKGFVEWLPRLGRALARGRWDTRTTITMMAEKNVQKNVYPRNGYHNLEWGAELINSRVGSIKVAFLWSKDDEMLADLTTFIETHQADGGQISLGSHGQ